MDLMQENWLTDVRNALRNLGKPSKLSDIYNEVEKIRDISHNEQPNAIIRRILQTYSKDTKTFKTVDSKYNFFGNNDIGDGIWFLRDNPLEIFQLGKKYKRDEIAYVLDKKNMGREGISYSDKHHLTIFFTDLNKEETSIKYNDYFENDYFHWDSQTKQHIGTPRIKQIVDKDVSVILFCRIHKKINRERQPFIYCGKLNYEEYEKGTSNPVHMIFNSEDYTDDGFDGTELREIWNWKTSRKGTTIDKSKSISRKRKGNYKKPTTTETRGLVTSRVGQGYYRREILNRWENKCAVKNISYPNILIASHIHPWKDSTEDERLCVGNGILLSPNIDALFDRHLISFKDDGAMLISSRLDEKEYEDLGLSRGLKLRKVFKDMINFLEKHRMKFYEKQDKSATVE
tara:strand:+ start:54 stop:1256 length:1203 start_codon:yes stop_codon:yes gene_type:complete